MDIFALGGTFAGFIFSAVAVGVSAAVYMKLRGSRTIWTKFIKMTLLASTGIFLLALVGLLKGTLGNYVMVWELSEIAIYAFIAFSVYYFYKTTIKTFEELLGVKI